MIILIDASERNIMYLYHSQYIWWEKEEGKWNFDKEILSKVKGSTSLNILYKVVEVSEIDTDNVSIDVDVNLDNVDTGYMWMEMT